MRESKVGLDRKKKERRNLDFNQLQMNGNLIILNSFYLLVNFLLCWVKIVELNVKHLFYIISVHCMWDVRYRWFSSFFFIPLLILPLPFHSSSISIYTHTQNICTYVRTCINTDVINLMSWSEVERFIFEQKSKKTKIIK